MSFRSLLRYFASGLLMGGADIIPGVSGGTMALIVGVYERLVAAISSATSLGIALLKFDLGRAREHARDMPWGLLLPLGSGILIAVAVGARVIPPLMDAYPHQMEGLFLGLVAASLVVPARRMSSFRLIHAGTAAAFAVTTFFLVGLPVFGVDDPGLVRVFVSAATAICAMILPGVSGAFLLKALGLYEPTLEALNGLLQFDPHHLPYVLTFVSGAVVGLGSFAKLLDWLLTYRHDLTMAALLGLIAGALRALWPYVTPNNALRLPTSEEPVASVVVLGVSGLALVLGLIWWTRPRPTPKASTS